MSPKPQHCGLCLFQAPPRSVCSSSVLLARLRLSLILIFAVFFYVLSHPLVFLSHTPTLSRSLFLSLSLALFFFLYRSLALSSALSFSLSAKTISQVMLQV